MPHLDRILETALYVDDIARACAFYEDIMGLSALLTSKRLCAYDVSGASVLLLFLRGGSTEGVKTDSGYIPSHDSQGQIHIAFQCSHAEIRRWEGHLKEHGVDIEGQTRWPRGGESIYFRDPDGHLLEIAASPGLWEGH